MFGLFTTKEKESIKILAPLTEERSALRQSLITPLYKVYEYNKAHDVENVSIFEIGKTFYMDKNSANNVDNCDEKYIEENKDTKCYCIRNNGGNLYNDLKIYLSGGSNYILFFDDINETNQLESILDS